MIPTERQEQIKLHQYCKLKKFNSFSVPNGGSRNMFEAKNLKAEGATAGVSDYIILLKNKILFIELKRQGKILKSGKISHSNSKISKEQQEFLDKVNKYPYSVGKICYGFNEAVQFINENNK